MSTSSRSELQRHYFEWPETVTELHAHLGGSVPLYRLWEIAVDRGIRGLGSGYENFINYVKIDKDKVKDLDSYLEVYDTIELIQSGPAALRESIIIAIHQAYRTGGMVHLGPGGEGGSKSSLFKIGKLELRFNPLKRTGAVFLKGRHAGLYDVDRVIKSACDAAEEVEIGFKGAIKVGLIFCFGRDMTFEANRVLAEKTALWSEKTDKIIGVDLAGHESVNPLSDPQKLQEMSDVFSIVPQKLGRTIHVGETPHVDLDTFLKTLKALHPQRIAHPIVAFKSLWKHGDERGVKLIKDMELTCEFCVKSNLLTKAVASVNEYTHIINTCDQYGIDYTFSTDAPALQMTSLAEELTELLKEQIITPVQLRKALKTADQKSFIKN
jgi:adenosine deaminase